MVLFALHGPPQGFRGEDDTGFEVALIPHTVAHTAFHALRVGDAVNLEVDLLARYLERLRQTEGWA